MKMCINLVFNAAYDVANTIGVKKLRSIFCVNIIISLLAFFTYIFTLYLSHKCVNGIKKTRHN